MKKSLMNYPQKAEKPSINSEEIAGTTKMIYEQNVPSLILIG